METPLPPPAAAVTQRRGWRGILRRAGLGLVLLLLVGVPADWLYRSARERELEAALAELDASDPGWRLEDIEAARPRVPDDENAAKLVQEAVGLLPKNWWVEELADALDVSPTLLNAEQSKQLRAMLAECGPSVTTARRLADFSRGYMRVDWTRDVISTPLPE